MGALALLIYSFGEYEGIFRVIPDKFPRNFLKKYLVIAWGKLREYPFL